jgi:hypothetical protein
VRWSLFAGLVVLVMLYLILGYLHAKRRIRKGLAPLRYHRVGLQPLLILSCLMSIQFLLSRKERAQHDPSYRYPTPDYSVYRPDQYGMHAYPPPVYDPNAPAPPSYQPPAGATKIDASQSRTGSAGNQPAYGEPSPEYTAPLGPPPAAALHATHTGSSSASNNPYRR